MVQPGREARAEWTKTVTAFVEERVCVLSHRTHREHVDEFIELIRRLSAPPAR
jgi:hypothetical protein